MTEEIELEDEIEEPLEEKETLCMDTITKLMETIGKGELFKRTIELKKKNPEWLWEKCLAEELKKEKPPEVEMKKEVKPEKNTESEEMKLLKQIHSILQKKPEEPEKPKVKPPEEKPEEEAEKDEKLEAANKKIEKLEEKLNRGIKTIKQPEELKEKISEIILEKDGAIRESYKSYCGW